MSLIDRSHSDSPLAQHATHTEWGTDRKHRWYCTCGKHGKKSYEMKAVASRAGWTHERKMNSGRP